MTTLNNLALCLLWIGSVSGCAFSPSQSEGHSDSIQVLDSLVLDSVPADFPVRFATLSRNNRQYVAYYNKDRFLTLASRHLNDPEWQYKTLDSRVGWDSHNSIVMTMDQNRCLHISGNMHNDTLVYFIASQPEDISSLKRVLPQVSMEDELRCTYPSFIKDGEGRLYFSYRIGGSGNGVTLLNRYNHESKSFERLSDKPLFDGLGQMSAYKSGPRLGPDGAFHVIWLWRDTPACETNHDLSYARSTDLVHWQSPGHEAIPVPISPEEKRFTVDPVPAGGGAINGNFRLFFTPQDQAMIAYLKYDEQGYSQVYLAHIKNERWETKKLSDWDYRWEFSGPGSITFEIRLGRANFTPEGDILINYSHIREGDGEMLIDGTTLELIEYRPLTKKKKSPYPRELEDPRSDLEGMQVHWMNLGRGSDPNSVSYFLRWETTGKRRYYKAPEVPVDPSPLTLYKIQPK